MIQTHTAEEQSMDKLAPAAQDVASLRLEMRASFHEINQRLKLLEQEQALLTEKFDTLLATSATASHPINGERRFRASRLRVGGSSH